MSVNIHFTPGGSGKTVNVTGLVGPQGPRGPQGYPGMESAEVQAIADEAASSASSAQASAASADASEAAAQASAIDADEAVTLAQQAQAAALEVPDDNVSALIGNPATSTRGALDSTYATRRLGLAGALTSLTARPLDTTAPTPLASFDGHAWGVHSGTIYQSTDGLTWTAYCPSPAGDTLRGLMPCVDGEVLALRSTSIEKSAGWASGAPTWTAKVTANGQANFIAGGLSGDGQKFISSQYGPAGAPGTQPYIDSRYGHISLDGGDTWTVAWDSVAQHGQAVADQTHLHSCAYDPWSDRFYLAEGHTSEAGIYVSDDDGATWTRPAGLVNNPPPTVLVPTDDGIVGGSDHSLPGIWSITRQPSATDEVIVRTWAWERGQDGVVGFGVQGYRDVDTGVVYIGFRTSNTAMPPVIAGGTASTAGLVYEYPATTVVSTDAITQTTVHEGKLLASSSVNGVNEHLVGRLSAPGSPIDTPISRGSTVTVGAGAHGADGSRNVLIGVDVTSTGVNSDLVAIGYNALADVTGCTAIGADTTAKGGNSTAIGRYATAAGQATAIGADSTTNGGTQAVAIGTGAQARSQSTVLGFNATVTSGSKAVAIGRNATVTTGATAVGDNASTAAFNSTVIGVNATSDYAGSVALGANSATTDANQVQIGGRHIEMTEAGTSPPAPATGGRLFVRVNTSGKTELCVRFPGAAAQVIAVEP